ncbi:hypothetical protein FSP39_016622 [Pinctada imbricata]|uniref:Uncharacterized protein n=1 Tax=Pinctada imbricata TaxID=66713 RepID=A0AA88YE12_PINIB|nr:hypothetical protein FSP39_016622 [Pinctada imbricata]
MSKMNEKNTGVCLKIDEVPEEIRLQKVSDKPPPTKRDRTSSSRSDGDDSVLFRSDLTEIKESMTKTLQSIFNRKEIEEIVKESMKEMVKSLKDEILKDIKEDIKKEIKEEIKSGMVKEINETNSNELEKLKDSCENQMKEMKTEMKEKNFNLNEKYEGTNLDIHCLREKLNKQEAELRKIRGKIKECEKSSKEVQNLANYNHQYSQKNNIKVLHWRETRGENLRRDFCEILQQEADVSLDKRDVLAIHRIPHGDKSGKSGPRPVIIRLINSEAKIAVMRNRKSLKEHFTLLDHLTPQNNNLLRKLREHPKIESAWHFNTRIYAFDCEGNKHRFDVCDDIDFKLRNVKTAD